MKGHSNGKSQCHFGFLKAITSITGQWQPPKFRRNLEDRNLATCIRNIQFIYCTRKANTLQDFIAKQAHIYNLLSGISNIL